MDVVNFEKAKKQIKKLPSYIKVKLLEWGAAIERDGIRKVRMMRGYHDEPLAGKRKGQRSVRLSKSFRAIYIEKNDGRVNVVIVEEVNKHDY